MKRRGKMVGHKLRYYFKGLLVNYRHHSSTYLHLTLEKLTFLIWKVTLGIFIVNRVTDNVLFTTHLQTNFLLPSFRTPLLLPSLYIVLLLNIIETTKTTNYPVWETHVTQNQSCKIYKYIYTVYIYTIWTNIYKSIYLLIHII